MDEQNRYPHDNNPYDHSDPTQPLPPYQVLAGQPGYQPGYPAGQQAGPPPPPPFRRARGATAAWCWSRHWSSAVLPVSAAAPLLILPSPTTGRSPRPTPPGR